MSLKAHINLVSSRNLTLHEKSKSEKKYFFKVPSPEAALTFSNCFSSSPKGQKPGSGYSKESFLQNNKNHPPLRTKSSLKEKDSRSLLYHHKHEVKISTITPRRDQTSKQKSKKILGDKDERSTDGTHSSLIKEFEMILSNKIIEAIRPETKSILNPQKHQRNKSTEQNNQVNQTKSSQSPANKPIVSQRDSKLSEYNNRHHNIESYPEQMHATILEFQSVLDNKINVEIKRPKHEIQELTCQVNKLKAMLQERDEVWQEKLNEALKKEKTLVVDSFKKMLSELKKMCQWQKVGGDITAINEPMITSSKKLFHNHPFQHQFKDSMDQIRNTLMELKILNSESQALRQELQNIRRALEEEREMRSNIEEELDKEKQLSKRIMKELSETRMREDECKIKIVSLENIIRLLKEGKEYETEYHIKSGQGNYFHPSFNYNHNHHANPKNNSHNNSHPNYYSCNHNTNSHHYQSSNRHHHLPHPITPQHKPEKQIIEFSVSSSKIILRDDHNKLKQSSRRLGDRLPKQQQQNDHYPLKYCQQRKGKAQTGDNTMFPINFRAKRKVSNEQGSPNKIEHEEGNLQSQGQGQ